MLKETHNKIIKYLFHLTVNIKMFDKSSVEMWGNRHSDTVGRSRNQCSLFEEEETVMSKRQKQNAPTP